MAGHMGKYQDILLDNLNVTLQSTNTLRRPPAALWRMANDELGTE